MKLWIDTEFNGWGGDLISMGITSEDGNDFYEVLGCDSPIPWVNEHVIPWFIQETISFRLFQSKLQSYINQWKEIHVIADWPCDLKYFMDSLTLGGGFMMNIPNKITTELVRGLQPYSLIPHNALEDARALKRAYLA